jgi:hypothetical protein
MKKNKLDWIISIIKEQMVTGSTAGAPGFSGSADPKGATAGFDPLMGKKKRDGSLDFRRIKSNYRKWLKYK